MSRQLCCRISNLCQRTWPGYSSWWSSTHMCELVNTGQAGNRFYLLDFRNFAEDILWSMKFTELISLLLLRFRLTVHYPVRGVLFDRFTATWHSYMPKADRKSINARRGSNYFDSIVGSNQFNYMYVSICRLTNWSSITMSALPLGHLQVNQTKYNVN